MTRFIARLISPGLVLGAILAVTPPIQMVMGAAASDTSGTTRDMATELKALVDSQIDTVGGSPIHNVVLLVEGPGFKWKGAAGLADGEGWQYADPNYVLLAMIIEKVTGSTLHAQFKARIFDQLGMENSYLEFYEAPRGSSRLSHAFFQQVDINRSVNTSFDWGGGGIVSTCEELNAFFRALLSGELFEKEQTLALMLAAADRGYGGEEYDYGLGIMKRVICGLTFYGHGGAYDCDVFYCPDEDISVCMSLNQMITDGKRDKFVAQAVEILTKR